METMMSMGTHLVMEACCKIMRNNKEVICSISSVPEGPFV